MGPSRAEGNDRVDVRRIARDRAAVAKLRFVKVAVRVLEHASEPEVRGARLGGEVEGLPEHRLRALRLTKVAREKNAVLQQGSWLRRREVQHARVVRVRLLVPPPHVVEEDCEREVDGCVAALLTRRGAQQRLRGVVRGASLVEDATEQRARSRCARLERERLAQQRLCIVRIAAEDERRELHAVRNVAAVELAREAEVVLSVHHDLIVAVEGDWPVIALRLTRFEAREPRLCERAVRDGKVGIGANRHRQLLDRAIDVVQRAGEEQQLAQIVVRARKVRLRLNRQGVQPVRLFQVAVLRRGEKAHPIQRPGAARVEAQRFAELRSRVGGGAAALQLICGLPAQRVRLPRISVPQRVGLRRSPSGEA